MAWTKTKIAIVTGVAVLLTAGVGTVAVRTIHAHRTQPNIQGAWEGALGAERGLKLRMVLHVSAVNGSYRATYDSIDQRGKDIKFDKFVYSYPSLELEDKAHKAIYKATLNSTADEMSGTWQQGGSTATMVLKPTATPDTVPDLLTESDYAPRAGSDLQGCWKGTLQAGQVALRLVFKIAEQTDGQFVAEMDSLDQGGNNVVVSSVAYDKPNVRIEVGLAGAVFQGKVSRDGGKITGTLTQARIPLPLTLERADSQTTKAEQAEAAAHEPEKDYSHARPDDLTGHWKGALDVKGNKLHLALHVGRLPNGDLAGFARQP